jgi:hypothetical protein
MAKVRLHFGDFAAMLSGCEDAYHFEAMSSEIGEIHLKLFIDGDPSDYEMSIRCGSVEVAKEMTL